MKQPIYRALASLIQGRANCAETGNKEWHARHTDRAFDIVKAHGPSGSGIDNGTSLDVDASTAEKLVFHTNYHHMSESGCYDGWTEHKVIVTPSLQSPGYRIRITGPDRNQIKDYMYDVFDAFLRTEVYPYASEE